MEQEQEDQVYQILHDVIFFVARSVPGVQYDGNYHSVHVVLNYVLAMETRA